MIDSKFKDWLGKQKKINKLKVNIVNLSKINNWNINKNEIFHKSKKFFKIVGLKINTNFHKRNWDQPIIVQNEVGILGLIKDIKKKNIYFKQKLSLEIKINYNYHLQYKQLKVIIDKYMEGKKFHI